MSRRAAFLVVALLCVGALLLRAPGIDYLLPEVMNRDGLVVIRQVQFLRTHAPQVGDPTWWYSSYPHLMARIAALLPVATPPHAGPLSLEEHLALARAPWIELRWISILLSLLAVPGTYLLARRFLDRGGALFAAALVATSLHHVCLSIQEKPHAASASLVLVALLAALRLRRRPDLGSYLLCAVAGALSIGMLHSGVVALLPIAAAFLLRDPSGRSGRSEGSGRRASAWWILAVVATAAIAIRVMYPFFFEKMRDPFPASTAVAGPDPVEFTRKMLAALSGAPVGRILRAVFALDPLLVGLGAAGSVVWCATAIREPRGLRARFTADLLVVLALALPCLVVLALFRGTLVRFFLPLTPIFACAAAYAFVRARDLLATRLRPGRPRALASSALGLALLVVPFAPAWHFARIRCEPGPMREASRWVVANVDPEETVAVVPYCDLALLPTADSISQNARHPWRTIWAEYLAGVTSEDLEGTRRSILIEPGLRPQSRADFISDPLAYLRRYRARWLVLDLSGGGAQLLEGRAERVARFSPVRRDGPNERGVLLFGTGYDALAPSALGILGMRSLGTSVEIFEIP